jgi:ferredoxin
VKRRRRAFSCTSLPQQGRTKRRAVYTPPMARKLKVSVDYDRCTGVGACEQVCPEVFFMRDDGLPEVLEPEPHETLWAAVERAEEACPEEAVVLEWADD